MLQIINVKSAGDCRFQGGLTVKKDPKDETAYTVGVKARFELADEADAKAWEGTGEWPVFPGASAYYLLASDEGSKHKWALTWTADHELIVTFAPLRNGKAAAGQYKGGAVITKATMSLSRKATRVDANLLFGGVKAEDIPKLVKLLRGIVHVETENRQLAMFEGEEDGEKKAAAK